MSTSSYSLMALSGAVPAHTTQEEFNIGSRTHVGGAQGLPCPANINSVTDYINSMNIQRRPPTS